MENATCNGNCGWNALVRDLAAKNAHCFDEKDFWKDVAAMAYAGPSKQVPAVAVIGGSNRGKSTLLKPLRRLLAGPGPETDSIIPTPPMSGSNHLSRLPTAKVCFFDDFRPIDVVQAASGGRGGVDLNTLLALLEGAPVTVTRSQCFASGNAVCHSPVPIFMTGPEEGFLEPDDHHLVSAESARHLATRIKTHTFRHWFDPTSPTTKDAPGGPCADCWAARVYNALPTDFALPRLQRSGGKPAAPEPPQTAQFGTGFNWVQAAKRRKRDEELRGLGLNFGTPTTTVSSTFNDSASTDFASFIGEPTGNFNGGTPTNAAFTQGKRLFPSMNTQDCEPTGNFNGGTPTNAAFTQGKRLFPSMNTQDFYMGTPMATFSSGAPPNTASSSSTTTPPPVGFGAPTGAFGGGTPTNMVFTQGATSTQGFYMGTPSTRGFYVGPPSPFGTQVEEEDVPPELGGPGGERLPTESQGYS